MGGSARDEPAVVVPAVGTASSVQCLRSLGRRSVHTIALSEKKNPPAFASRYCDERIRAPPPSTHLDEYRDLLLDLARRDDVAAVIPVREPDIYALATARETFAEHVEPLWPSASQLEAVHDRTRLLAAADRAGVAAPETQLLDEVDDWSSERIVKARYGILTNTYLDSVSTGRCVSPPKTMYLEPGVRPDVEAIAEAMGHTPLAQQYLRGTEYCMRAFYHDGEPVVTSQKRLLRGYKYPRGPSIYHEATDIPQLERAGLALLDELDWEGVASVGFIRDESGEFKLLEINPRFWASLPMDVHAGVDYPYYYWRIARGQSVNSQPAYRPGTASHLLRGEVVHFHSVLTEDYPLAERPSVPGTAWQILTSLYRHPRFDYLSVDDPRPFARDVLNAARSLVAP